MCDKAASATSFTMMGYKLKSIRLATALLLCGFARGDDAVEAQRTLTHADAAVILAKYSGFFDRYVEKDADLTVCVRFLNKTGIYFGLMEVVNGSEFTLEDCARAMGQIDLVLSGEAEFLHGKVKLPKGIETWKEFCSMHGVEYVEGHQAMLNIVNLGDSRKR